jgi:hypothetical protein
MFVKTSLRTILAVLAFATFGVSATTAFADEVKVPQTTAEHEELAKSYRDQAAQYKKVADDHRAMAEAYKKTIGMPPVSKGGVRNPWLEKMQKHCAMLAKDADKLAADAEKAAEYHTLRGKELQGK